MSLNPQSKIKGIFVGASAGGISAVQRLLSAMSEIRIPVVFVLHFPPQSELNVKFLFSGTGNLKPIEVTDKLQIECGNAYFAPPDYHVLVEVDAALSLSQDSLVHQSRPSIDVLFESAAASLGAAACGVLLTGANSDGAAGLLEIQRSGGLTAVQTPRDAEFRTMPESALALITPDCEGDLDAIADFLGKL